MKTKVFLAAAVAAMAAVVSCKQPTEYQKMRAEVVNEMSEFKPSEGQVDTVSYLMGVNIGMMLKGQGFAESMNDLDMDKFQDGIAAALKASDPKGYMDSTFIAQFDIDPYSMNEVFPKYVEARMRYKAEINLRIGEKLLEQNAKKEGVVVAESGLQYIIHNEGEGAKVTPEDKVFVTYTGSLLDGKEFDHGDSVAFSVNRVVAGFGEGLQLLGEGGKATLFIPAALGYGERAPQAIGPNSALKFEVEIKKIERPEPVQVAEEVVEK